MVHFGEFLKTWSLRSNSVTRQVSFNRTKIGGKCQNSKIQIRHFGWFSNTVYMLDICLMRWVMNCIRKYLLFWWMVRLDKRLWIISVEWKYIPLRKYGFHLKMESFLWKIQVVYCLRNLCKTKKSVNLIAMSLTFQIEIWLPARPASFLKSLWVDDGVLEMLRGSLRPSLSIATLGGRPGSAQEIQLYCVLK